ncbi:hypothetical protein, partial [Thermodesulfitimonas sp.]
GFSLKFANFNRGFCSEIINFIIRPDPRGFLLALNQKYQKFLPATTCAFWGGKDRGNHDDSS